MRGVDLGDSPITAVLITIEQRPPYYSGPMPLKFKSGVKAFFFGKGITVQNTFDGFHTEYSYSEMAVSGIAAGARTTDASGNLLAEAQMTKPIQPSGRFDGIEIEEVHYDKGGNLEFKCRSQIDRLGFKVSEIPGSGKKTMEYYFVWPTTAL